MARAPRKERPNLAAFAKALEALRPEHALARAMIEARMRAGLTQAALAARMGTRQTAIARLEAGRGSPSVATLKKWAAATGSRLVVRLDALS
jgi:transcriptional regulator with XRE-family HTH domain